MDRSITQVEKAINVFTGAKIPVVATTLFADGIGRANSRSLSVIQVTLGSHELECPNLVAADPFRGFLDGVHVFHAE